MFFFIEAGAGPSNWLQPKCTGTGSPTLLSSPFPPADIPSSVELKHVSMQSEQEDEEAGEVSGEHQEGAQEEEEEGPRPPVQLLSPPPHP